MTPLIGGIPISGGESGYTVFFERSRIDAGGKETERGMEGVTAWYVILSVSVLLIALLLRFSTYTVLVRQLAWLPERAGRTANVAFGASVFLGFGILLARAFLSSRY